MVRHPFIEGDLLPFTHSWQDEIGFNEHYGFNRVLISEHLRIEKVCRSLNPQ